MRHAGSSVVFSGTTVAISLLALVVLPIPFLRNIGIAGLLIALVSVLVAVTLLPVLLATIGPKLDWPRSQRDARASRGWSAWARLVVRHRWAAAAGSTAVLAALVVAAVSIQLGNPRADSLANAGPDYQVFIISRMREAYDRTGSTETAVVEGIGRTGRLVTSAALILGLAFAAFSATPGTEAKIFAVGLGGGILIDATIIRGILAPAVVALLGRWNWWLPVWAARLLRVEPSRTHPEPPLPPVARPAAVL
jgi:uncharacterized membrane protein YdfJ with MMPL/SSD domain